MSKPRTRLGARLLTLRAAKGYATKRDFALALGISENRYARYERGEAVPKLPMAQSICALLGITADELYGWDAEDTRPVAAGAVTEPEARGFAEAGPEAQAEDGGARVRAADRTAWRLATMLSRAQASRDRSSGKGASGELAAMRATADLFLRLKQDPLSTIAHALQSMTPGAMPPDIEQALTSEIEAFIAALDPHGGAG